MSFMLPPASSIKARMLSRHACVCLRASPIAKRPSRSVPTQHTNMKPPAIVACANGSEPLNTRSDETERFGIGACRRLERAVACLHGLRIVVDLAAHLAEFLRHLRHAGFLVVERGRIVAHVLGDLHRAEFRPA